MRFHMGVSFSLHKLKKFIIPFLIGLATCFGLGFLSCIQVNATVQDSYFYSLSNNDIYLYDNLDTTYFGNNTLHDVIDDLKSMELTNTDYSILFELDSSSHSINKLVVLAFPKSTNYIVNIGSTSTFKNVFFIFKLASGNSNNRVFTFSPYYDNYQSLFSSELYTSMKTCFDNLTTCPTSKPTETVYNGSMTVSASSNYTSNNVIYSGGSDSNVYAAYNVIYYYSTHDLTYSNTGGSNSYYYRDVFLNDSLLEENSTFSSYIDSVPVHDNSSSSDDNVELKGLTKYVFWFFNPQSRNDILTNLYTIIFLFVVGTLTIKFLTIIHNTKWRR